jgi:hypothetical protein
MTWVVNFHPEYESEFDQLSDYQQDEILAAVHLLEQFGYQLGRPTADTLKGSKHANMKELRVRIQKEFWRVAYAFDPASEAILLVGGDKGGQAQMKFYKKLIALADERFGAHLTDLKKGKRP